MFIKKIILCLLKKVVVIFKGGDFKKNFFRPRGEGGKARFLPPSPPRGLDGLIFCNVRNLLDIIFIILYLLYISLILYYTQTPCSPSSYDVIYIINLYSPSCTSFYYYYLSFIEGNFMPPGPSAIPY